MIHKDYTDRTRKPAIRFFSDCTLLWNPSVIFVSAEELLEPGLLEPGERDARNPRIVAAFRRIGLSDQAGTGIHAIFGTWRRLGHVPPVVESDKVRRAFQ